MKFAFLSLFREALSGRLKRTVRLGIKSLWLHRLRSLPTVLGIVFGVYPAWKASNLDPIESLRYE